VVVATPLAAYARCGDVLVGLLAPRAVRVPGSLAVPARLVEDLRPGDELLVGGGGVVAGGMRLAVGRWWDSAVPRLRALTPPPVLRAPEGVPNAVAAGACRLNEALGHGGEVRDAVRDLVGLGPGLTPAGDDVVAGTLVALVAAGDLARAGAVLDAVRPCRHRTTALSAALLDHAAAGRAVPQLARYLHAPTDPAALAGLRAVGGTSGAALTLGAGIGLSVAAATMTCPVDREVA
jgi:hypothetical protein